MTITLPATRAFIQVDFWNCRRAITNLEIDRGTVADLRANPANLTCEVDTGRADERF